MTYQSTHAAATSANRCGAAATPSTTILADGATTRTALTIAPRSCACPRTFEQWPTATTRVRLERSAGSDSTGSLPVSFQCTVLAPVSTASLSHGRRCASWFQPAITISSPGPTICRNFSARKISNEEAFGPNVTTCSSVAPRRRRTVSRALRTQTKPGPLRWRRSRAILTHVATCFGTWVPPAFSRKIVGCVPSSPQWS
mmetsp:Transcript_27148/g.54321  ORF Transcript_27148/g.54321 Transcript_27148/m.54321 type:complete len:200 (-) Transcript_27148:779-1378(-)